MPQHPADLGIDLGGARHDAHPAWLETRQPGRQFVARVEGLQPRRDVVEALHHARPIRRQRRAGGGQVL